ncbi:MAG: DUF4275 family protein [Velocimicrobium sp.]
MSLENLKKNIIVVNEMDGSLLRNQFIQKFILTEKDYYKKNILSTQTFSDGICYTGYLWDCLNEVEVIDFNYINSMRNSLAKVYVLWDIHSKDRILIEDYWKFEKNDILLLDFCVLLDNLEYLPEDIYIFNESFNWTFVLTHEYFDNKRWCLKSGNI